MEQNNDVERGIGNLSGLLKSLVDVWSGVVSKTHSHSGDPLTFMTLTFAVRQGEHAQSVIALGRSLDTGLIVRSMLEGLVQLLWATEVPDRAAMWRRYGAIRDWRSVKQITSSGIPVPPERVAQVERDLASYGPLFLTKKGKEARDRGEPLDDPYRTDWHGMKMRAMFKAVEGDLFHEHVYRPFSDFHHWDVAGFEWESDDRGDVTLRGYDPTRTVTALAVAFQCLHQTLWILDERLQLAIKGSLERLADEHQQMFSTVLPEI